MLHRANRGAHQCRRGPAQHDAHLDCQPLYFLMELTFSINDLVNPIAAFQRIDRPLW